MALTLSELFSTDAVTAGLKTGGALTGIFPPAGVVAGGPLAIIRWVLDNLVDAQAANVGTSPNVIRRQTVESGGNLISTYTVVLASPVDSVSDALAAAVVDNFS